MSLDAHGRPTDLPLVFTSDDVPAPTHADRARTLLASQSTGALGTLATEPSGHPYVAYVTFALDGSTPIFCLSRIAEHGKNLAADARVSLMVHESTKADPLANARLTLLGRAIAPEHRDRAREAFLASNPHAKHYVDYADFSFHALELESARYIGGYGRMSWVTTDDFRAGTVDPIAPHARGILDHMNDDHADALLTYARAFTTATDATAATMTAVDRLGFEMTVDTPRGRGPARLAFAAPIGSAKDARVALVALVAEARAKLT